MRGKTFKLILIATLICGILTIGSPIYALIYDLENTIKGLKNIQPNDTLNFPLDTTWATLTATWGVRIEFIDYDESIIKSEVVEVNDTEKGNTTMPNDPKRKNYKFMGWTRYDENSGLAYINEDGTLSDIVGPGPIIYIANYQIVDDNYKVNYIIEDDNNWGAPDESVIPIDTNTYVYNDNVKVLAENKNLKGYAVDSENGKKISGSWKFELDEENNPEINSDNEFIITENTEVKGAWTFEPDPVKLKYNVIKDKSWGEPSDSTIVSTETEHEYKTKVKISGSMEPYKGTALDIENGKNVLGTWKYELKEEKNLELNEENEFVILENTELKGIWTFSPDKLRVEYVTTGDDIWGKPADEVIPVDYNLYNYKDNINVINKNKSIKGNAINLKTGESVDGKWVLVVEDTDTIITENKTINGKWTFIPNVEANPKTGDDVNYYVMICVISLLVLIVSVYYIRKNLLKGIKSNK